MAIIFEDETNKGNPARRFSRPFRAPAGSLSMILSILAGIGIVLHLLQQDPQTLPAESLGLHLAWTAAFAVMALLGFFVILGKKQAFWITLAFWLVMTGSLVAQAFGGLLWGMKSILPSDQPVWAVIILIGGISAGFVIIALQVLATAHGSRNRFGAMVGVSVAAAITVVIVINMIAFRYPYRQDFETLGRFGLSERTVRILEKVNQPIEISVIYAAAKGPADTEPAREKRRETQKYLQRITELFEDIHAANPKITAVDASGDAARSMLLSRLRERQHAATHPHEALLEKIRAMLPELERQLQAEKDKWANIPSDSYLGLWNTGPAVQETLVKLIRDVEQTAREVSQELNSKQLPDYVGLLKKLTDELQTIRQTLEAYDDFLLRVSKLPGKVKANSPLLINAMDKCVLAVTQISTLAGESGAALPEDPGPILKELAVAIGQASTRVRDAAYRLDTLAGKDTEDIQLLSVCKAWEVDIQRRDGETVRSSRGRLLDELARQLETLRAQIALQISDANVPAQQRAIKQLRLAGFQLSRVIKSNQDSVAEGIARLMDVDKETGKIFASLEKGDQFDKILQRISPLLAEAGKLQAPAKDSLLPDISGENIIVIETPEKVDVIPFDEVWPAEMKADFFLRSGEEPNRFFNGDAVIASRILALTEDRPFGRVLLTYYRPPLPQGVDPMRFRPPPGPIPYEMLQEIRRNLQEANFLVDTWNLADPMPPLANATTTPATEQTEMPTVLLILPPAEPVIVPGANTPPARFGQAQLTKVSKAIDSGVTAVFLAKTLIPRILDGQALVTKYDYNDYLIKNWGIDVRAEAVLLFGLPDEESGKFLLDINKLAYMPLNSFSDHPVGKSLRGRRLAWKHICPIIIEPKDKRPAGVDIQDVLTVPETMTNIWATDDLVALGKELHFSGGNLISPHYDKGDMKVPLVVAAAATRAGEPSEDIAPSRIVVLGLGGGLDDAYLTAPRESVEGGYRTAQPPRGNVDLIVNSVYWLTGRESFIAAGPLRFKPVGDMSQTTQNILWSACVIALPLTVLAIGGVVMLIRRR